MQRIERFATPRILTASSLLLLAATALLYVAYGPRAYFLAFHKPFHMVSLHGSSGYTPPVLPTFTVTSSISRAILSPGDTEEFKVTETSDRTVSGFLEVWVQSPAREPKSPTCAVTCLDKQVYKSKISDKPTQFIKGKPATFTYTYTLPATLRPGTYQVSDLITSSDTFTDYYVHNNFAEFTVL
jgi:hypothetical protein